MPRCFLHLRDGGDRIADAEGETFADLEAAREEDWAAVPDLWSRLMRWGHDPMRYRFEIEGPSGDVELVVLFADVLARVRGKLN